AGSEFLVMQDFSAGNATRVFYSDPSVISKVDISTLNPGTSYTTFDSVLDLDFTGNQRIFRPNLDFSSNLWTEVSKFTPLSPNWNISSLADIFVDLGNVQNNIMTTARVVEAE